MKTILVTGAAGFIGSHLCDRLLASGHLVTGVDDFNDYYEPSVKRRNLAEAMNQKAFTLVIGDVRDYAKMLDTFSHRQFDAVIHLAARAGVRASLADPELYFDVNINGTKNILNMAKSFKVNKLIFGSSSSVYGTNKKVPFSEDDPLNNIISPYAESKKKAESLCREYHDCFGMQVACLRFFTVYGPRGRPDMAPYTFTRSIMEGKEIIRFGDGSTKRDYTYIDDIEEGIVAALARDIDFDIINLGGSSPISLNSFIAAIEHAVGKKAKIKQMPMQEGDVPVTFADIRKAERLLGYKPKVKIGEGIKRMVEWLKNEQ